MMDGWVSAAIVFGQLLAAHAPVTELEDMSGALLQKGGLLQQLAMFRASVWIITNSK